MPKQHISKGLREFIREEIQTIFRLEVLLLLHRDQSRSFTVVEVASELGFENDVAQEQLMGLVASNLIVQSHGEEIKFRYRPADVASRSFVDQLAVGYSKQRVPILSAILAEPRDRIRLFAEAFRITRGPD